MLHGVHTLSGFQGVRLQHVDVLLRQAALPCRADRVRKSVLHLVCFSGPDSIIYGRCFVAWRNRRCLRLQWLLGPRRLTIPLSSGGFSERRVQLRANTKGHSPRVLAADFRRTWQTGVQRSESLVKAGLGRRRNSGQWRWFNLFNFRITLRTHRSNLDIQLCC